MDFQSRATTNKLLLIIALPLVFYVLHLLSFILVPLFFAIFLSLLFMPTMRWLQRKRVPKWISVIIVLLVLSGTIFGVVQVVAFSGQELNADKDQLFNQLNSKAGPYLHKIANYLEIEQKPGQTPLKNILTSDQMSTAVYQNFSITFSLIQKSISDILITLFFMVLLLSGSLNFKEFLQLIFFKKSYPSIRTFMVIERSIVKFLRVKTIVSFFTGLGVGLVCYFFDLSFPFFWGLFGFAINYVQFVGSVVVTVLVALQAFIEINFPGTLLLVILLLIGVQLIFGSIVEPVMLGRSFSINVLAVIVMLMFWGFLWGVPGLILSIPLTVLIKTMLEQFPNSRRYAVLLS